MPQPFIPFAVGPGQDEIAVCVIGAEGIIIAGVGNFFFLEPVPVSAAMIRFDESGSADIRIKEGAEQIEKQLAAMEAIRAAAADELGITREGSSS